MKHSNTCHSMRQYWRSMWRQSVLGVAILALTRSFQQYLHGVSADIGDCGIRITPPMLNRVTNHGDMGIFSRPAWVGLVFSTWCKEMQLKLF